MLSALKELTDTEEGDRQAHGCLKSGGDLKGDWLPARRGRGAAGRKEQDTGAHINTLERAYTAQCSQGAVSGPMAGLIFALFIEHSDMCRAGQPHWVSAPVKLSVIGN